jgi:hypothetical protein
MTIWAPNYIYLVHTKSLAITLSKIHPIVAQNITAKKTTVEFKIGHSRANFQINPKSGDDVRPRLKVISSEK